jgi:putative membrane protein
MRWWCAAQSVAWSWSWQPYPGVWLFILSFLAVGLAMRRRAAARGQSVGPARTTASVTGLLLLWLALDWPVGALGAGYLASVHMAQFILVSLLAPPLLLLGVPAAALSTSSRWLAHAGRVATHPITAIAAFFAAVIVTHLPPITDRLMPSQLGAFIIDVLWLAAGVVYWWPVIVPVPARAWFTSPVRIAYLFASMVLMTAPGAMITFSDLPIYAVYELAPPIPGVSALEDQRIAGLGMRFGGALVTWIAISIVFLRWNREEERLMREERAREGGAA